MIDEVDAFHRFGNGAGIGDIAFDQFDAERFDVVREPGAEIVEHANRVTAADQSLRDIRSDKTRATGNQVFCHRFNPTFRMCYLSEGRYHISKGAARKMRSPTSFLPEPGAKPRCDRERLQYRRGATREIGS